MTSHHQQQGVYNEQQQHLQSPKKEIMAASKNISMMEISPTGIMGFPEQSSGGKRVVPRTANVPTLATLDDEQEQQDTPQVLQHRITATGKYWHALEQEFLAHHDNDDDAQQFFVPRCDNPFEAFMVHDGHVRGMVDQWNALVAAEQQQDHDVLVAPMVPMPGHHPVVLKLAAFFDHLAQQRLLQDTMEPFVAAYQHSLSHKMRTHVQKWQERCDAAAALEKKFVPIMVYRHVSPKVQPLVDFWNNLGQVSEPPRLQEPPELLPKSPKLVVMANLMQKKLEHLDTPKKAPKPTIEMDASTTCLVVEMVSLLEGMNYNTKTGVGGNPLDAGHVHHVNSLRLVY